MARGDGFIRRLGLMGIAVLSTVLITSAPARSAESVDQSCAVAPPVVSVWASYSLDQSFTPLHSAVSAWEAKFFTLEAFDGPLRSRLVYNPLGDNAVGSAPLLLTASGIVVAEAIADVRSSKNKSFWVRFKPVSPVSVLPGAPLGSYSIQVDTPLDPAAPLGTRIGWWSCGADYKRGAAYHAIHPQGAGEFSRDAVGVHVPTNGGPGTRQPLVRQKHAIADLQFRVFSPT